MPPRPTLRLRAVLPSAPRVALPSSTRLASTSSLLSSTASAASSSSTHLSSTSSAPTPPPSLHEEAAGTVQGTRIYTARKTFLWNYYTHLLDRSDLLLVFEHANISAGEWNAIRRAISKIPAPAPSALAPTISLEDGKAASASAAASESEKASLNVVRTGVFASLATSSKSPLSSHLTGQRAILSCPSLSPIYLSKILSTITRSIKSIKRENSTKQPTLTLIAGLLEENKIMDEKTLVQVGKLPELNVLRAQVVGLLESQGRSLVGVLGQAAGGSLVRTLQGLEADLKEKEGGSGSEASPSGEASA